MLRRSALTALLLLLLLMPLVTLRVSATMYAPNHFLGTCLDAAWVTEMETSLGVKASDRDDQGRLVNPYLHAALQFPRYNVTDARLDGSDLFANCDQQGIVYGYGATLDDTGAVVDRGDVSGTFVVERKGWQSHALTSLVLSILAAEAVGYTPPLSPRFFI